MIRGFEESGDQHHVEREKGSTNIQTTETTVETHLVNGEGRQVTTENINGVVKVTEKTVNSKHKRVGQRNVSAKEKIYREKLQFFDPTKIKAKIKPPVGSQNIQINGISKSIKQRIIEEGRERVNNPKTFDLFSKNILHDLAPEKKKQIMFGIGSFLKTNKKKAGKEYFS